MFGFYTLAGTKHTECIPISVKTEDGKYRTAIDIAKATIPDGSACRDDTMIVLFKQEDNILKLLNPSDIIEEPTDFVVINISDKTLESCAKEGLIDMAKWLRAYGHEWSIYVIGSAAKHIGFAKWALENGCPLHTRAMENAASNNSIEFGKWARENGCPWNSSIISDAAYNGHIEFAKWALANGCPRGDYVIDNAVYNNHIKFAQWALDNGYSLNNTILPDGQCSLSANYGPIVCKSGRIGPLTQKCILHFFFRTMGPRAAEILSCRMGRTMGPRAAEILY
jgi:hypothetical protein